MQNEKTMKRKIFISGVHSGQNPCSGLGIARCIKQAFPELTLVGVDHWQGSSGLHDPIVNETLLLPQWSQINNERLAERMRSLLNEGHLWIPALDLEVYWLSEKFGAHPGLLAPSEMALGLTAKPEVSAMSELGFHVPAFICASGPDSEIHSFLRRNSWQCWLKSPYHEAIRIPSWAVFERARAHMRKNWRTTRLFAQRHVPGKEESIAFVAYQGELLSAVHLEKLQATSEGKTWAGRVTAAPIEVFKPLQEAIRRLCWSGGGEIEYMKDTDGRKWVIECNPRFPAWIFGGTIAGHNLPAKLVARAMGITHGDPAPLSSSFTRVVQEIPVRESVGLSLPLEQEPVIWTMDGKMGKGVSSQAISLPSLRGMIEEGKDGKLDGTDQPPEFSIPAYFEEIDEATRAFSGETPVRLFLRNWTRSRFQALLSSIHACRENEPRIRVGYSLKTSPTEENLRIARQCGFLAECISQLEIQKALSTGFRADEIILNGPGKFWPLHSAAVPGLHMIFCDSLEELDRVLKIPNIARRMGFRIRLPKLVSRFGNPIGEFKDFQRLLHAVRRLEGRAPLGFHFHMPSWLIGVPRWMDALKSLLTWCQTMEKLSGVPVQYLDLGGGYFPADLESLDFAGIQKLSREALPHARSLYIEPGRSLTQDSEILASRVLDVRRSLDREITEIVVDACIAELPLSHAFSHRVFYRSQAAGRISRPLMPLRKGKTRILGRICMEDDILNDGVSLPENVDIGDLIIFGDAGGYERSMSYAFGRG